MLSRVADSLYWMSRYLERAEHIARQLDIHLNLVLDQSNEAAGRRRGRLIECVATGSVPTTVRNDYEFANLLTFDSANESSLLTCIALARENARQIREQINSLIWEKLNQLYLTMRQSDMGTIWDGQPHEFYHSVNENIYLIQGMTDSRMSHDQGWHFMRLGQYLERAIAIAVLADHEFRANYNSVAPNTVSDHQSYLDWVGLLRGCAAFEAYSKVYTAEIQPRYVAEFLLLNPTFPHSLRYATDVVQSALTAIANETDTHKGARVNRLAGRLGAMLDFAQIDEVLDADITTYLTEIQHRCFQIHNAVYQTYISYPIEEKLAV